METILQRYKDYLCGEFPNKTTRKNNFNVAKQFYDFVKGVLSNESVRTWKQHINDTKEHNTINVYISSVNKFLTWQQRPELRMKTIGQKQTDKVTLTEPEMKELIKTSENEPETHLIVLFLFHALRPNDIINVKLSNLKDDVLYLKDTKTGDNHTILNKTIQDAWIRYLRVRPKPKQKYKDYLFICRHSNWKGKAYTTTLPIEKKIQSLAKDVGIKKDVTPYTIRRTSATLRLDKNSSFFAGDVKIVQRLFRHRNPETTLRYDHKTDDDLRRYLQDGEKDLIKDEKDLTDKQRTYHLNNLAFSTEINEVDENNSSFSFSFSFSFFFFCVDSFQRKTAVSPESDGKNIVDGWICSYSFLKVSVCCPEEGFSLTCDGKKARGGATEGYQPDISFTEGFL